MKNAIIRALKRDDLPRVGQLAQTNGMFPSEMLEDMTAPFFAGHAASHRWLVHDGGTVDGVVYYVPEMLTDGTWNLLLIAVDKSAHGQGIGTRLMRHVENDLRASSARVLLVETSGLPHFARTRGFYEMLGYGEEARIRDYYSSGDDKVIFRKSLV
ncbi:MAG TPA: GNAT family N-acetyltransferase [Erythrobacter sp.]|nr:GNAT family N-acetyltransferase [Erythrobacter sp.]